MGFFRRVSRAIRRVGRTVERVGRRTGRFVDRTTRDLVLDPNRRFLRGFRDITIDPFVNPNQDFMKQQANFQKEQIQAQEDEAKKAQEEAEQAVKDQNQAIKDSFTDTSSALGSLGVSSEQVLGGTSSALGEVRKKRRK